MSYAMIPKADSDPEAAKTAPLPFADGELDRFGVRMRPADFSRLMGCTKQCVSDWIKSGKITLGADGRLDPRQAVRQLLRNSDPARLRARVLAPLVRELEALRAANEGLQARLTRVQQEREFSAAANAELIDQWTWLRTRVLSEWPSLREVPAAEGAAALAAWCRHVENFGTDPGPILGSAAATASPTHALDDELEAMLADPEIQKEFAAADTPEARALLAAAAGDPAIAGRLGELCQEFGEDKDA